FQPEYLEAKAAYEKLNEEQGQLFSERRTLARRKKAAQEQNEEARQFMKLQKEADKLKGQHALIRLGALAQDSDRTADKKAEATAAISEARRALTVAQAERSRLETEKGEIDMRLKKLKEASSKHRRGQRARAQDLSRKRSTARAAVTRAASSNRSVADLETAAAKAEKERASLEAKKDMISAELETVTGGGHCNSSV
ncbi:hypothetical protein KIPB_013991, partial [Kipferlia bialata]